MIDLKRYETATWVSTMPTLQRVIEAGTADPGSLSAPVMHGVARLAELATGRTWLRLQQRTAAAPAGQNELKSFEAYVGLLDQLPAVSSAWASTASSLAAAMNDPSKLSKAVIDLQVNALSKAYAVAASDIPILDMVIGFVALGVNVGRTIWLENADAKPGELPLELDPEEDTRRGNELLDVARTDDWTDLFSPYHDASGPTQLHSVPVEYGTGYKGGRFWWAQPSGEVRSLGQGIIPGGGVARLWQFRGKQATTGWTGLDRLLAALHLPIAAGKDFERYTTYGVEYFRPAFEQVGQVLWSQVTTPGPTMFKVDAAKLRARWQSFWGSVVQAFMQLRADDDDKGGRLIMSVLFGSSGASFPDWPHPYDVKGVVERVPEKYRDLLPYSLVKTGKTLYLPGGVTVEERLPDFEGISWWVTRRGTTLRYVDNLEDAQRHELGRLTVAYLTGDEPGLQGKGSAMHELWEQRRVELLDHPALANVDFERVPPSDWRKEAVARKLKLIKGVTFIEPAGPKLLTPRFPWGFGQLPTKAVGKPAAFEKPVTENDPRGRLLVLLLLALGGFAVG